MDGGLCCLGGLALEHSVVSVAGQRILKFGQWVYEYEAIEAP